MSLKKYQNLIVRLAPQIYTGCIIAPQRMIPFHFEHSCLHQPQAKSVIQFADNVHAFKGMNYCDFNDLNMCLRL